MLYLKGDYVRSCATARTSFAHMSGSKSGSSHDARRVFAKIRKPKNHRRCIMSTYAIIKLAENKLKLKLVKQSTLKKNWTLKLVKKFNEVVVLVVKTLVMNSTAGATVVELLKKQENKRKLLLTSTNLKKVATVNKVTVNHIQRVVISTNQRLILRRTHGASSLWGRRWRAGSANCWLRRKWRIRLRCRVPSVFLRLPLTLSNSIEKFGKAWTILELSRWRWLSKGWYTSGSSFTRRNDAVILRIIFFLGIWNYRRTLLVRPNQVIWKHRTLWNDS